MYLLRSLSAGCMFAVSLLAPLASAAEFTLIYTDNFTSQDTLTNPQGVTSPFSDNTPFQIVARFDNATPSFHLPGFNAYAPINATLTIGNASYQLTDADVSIFDSTNPFNKGRYAAGFIQQPALDQAGFTADFSSVTTPFTVGNLVPTEFTGYNGTGFQPGAGLPPGCGGACTSHNTTPLHLTGSDGLTYLLTPGARDSGPSPAATAALTATPEPGSFGLLLVGAAGGLGWLRSRLKMSRPVR